MSFSHSAPLTRLFPFLLGFGFFSIHYLGLPFDFTKDYIYLLTLVGQYRYWDLIRWSLNPLTPAWFFIEDIVPLRPLGCLIAKFNLEHFGASAVPFQLLDGIACGILCALFWVLIFRLTSKRMYAWIALVFYLMLPPNLYAVLLYPRMEYIFSLLRLLPILFFLYVAAENSSDKKFSWNLFFCYAAVVACIKFKSSEKILPFVLGAFLVLRLRPLVKHLGKGRVAMMAGVVLLMMASVVPIRLGFPDSSSVKSPAQAADVGFDRKEKQIQSWNLQNMAKTLIHHPDGEFPRPHSGKHRQPMTLTENLGLILGPLFWLSLLVAFLGIFRLKQGDEFLVHAFWLFFLWFGAVALGTGTKLAAGNMRYLNYIFVPAIPLFFASLSIVERAFFGSLQSRWRKIGEAFLIGSFAFTIVLNSAIFYYLLIHFGGGMTYTVIEADKAVFRDVYHREPQGHEIYYSHVQFKDDRMLMDWHDDFYQVYDPIVSKIPHGGNFYYLTQNLNSPKMQFLKDKGHAPLLLATLNFLDAPPLIFKIWKAAKSIRGRQNKRQTYVYRMTV